MFPPSPVALCILQRALHSLLATNPCKPRKSRLGEDMALLAKVPHAERDGSRDIWGSVVLPFTAPIMLQDAARPFRFEQL